MKYLNTMPIGVRDYREKCRIINKTLAQIILRWLNALENFNKLQTQRTNERKKKNIVVVNLSETNIEHM